MLCGKQNYCLPLKNRIVFVVNIFVNVGILENLDDIKSKMNSQKKAFLNFPVAANLLLKLHDMLIAYVTTLCILC